MILPRVYQSAKENPTSPVTHAVQHRRPSRLASKAIIRIYCDIKILERLRTGKFCQCTTKGVHHRTDRTKPASRSEPSCLKATPDGPSYLFQPLSPLPTTKMKPLTLSGLQWQTMAVPTPFPSLHSRSEP